MCLSLTRKQFFMPVWGILSWDHFWKSTVCLIFAGLKFLLFNLFFFLRSVCIYLNVVPIFFFFPQTITVACKQFWPYLCKNVTSMSHMATLLDWSFDRHIQHEVKGQSPNSGLLSHFLVNIFNLHLLAHHTSIPLEIWFSVLSDM